MVSFSDPVAVPPTSAYGPPAVDFSWLANLPNQYFKAKQNQFQDQQNQNTTQQQQAFKNGLPIDPATGQPDYKAITQILAQKGDINAIAQLGPLVQAQTNGQVNPLTAQLLGMPPQGGGAQPAQPQGQPQPQPQPQKTPATVQGGNQSGSIVDVVTAKIPQEQAGPVIARIAQVVGLDPNAALTPGQQVRVNGLVQRYTQTGASPAAAAAPAAAPSGGASPGSTSARVDSGFSAFPPSAGNVSPAAQPRPPAQQQPAQQPPARPAPPQAQPQQQPVAQPQQQQAAPQQPLVPQVPLPVDPRTGKQFTDPQAAIQAIDRAMIGERNPQAIAALKDYRDRIAASAEPQKVGPYETLVDPRTGQPIYRGPMAQAAVNPEISATLDADAERYRQTGTLPPNMGRGIQGTQQATAIRTRAVQQEVDAGGDPGSWPQRWQQFKTQGGYPDQVKDWSEGIKSGDIPPVGIPAKIRGPVTANLEEGKFNLSKATIEWNRAQKQIQALNGPQMTRFVGLATSVTNTIDEVNELSEQMKLSGIPLLNRAELSTYIQTQGNSANGQLAARYIGAVGTLKEEFANLAQGGYAPTEPAWTLANRQINEDYGVKELGASLGEVQRLIKYRINAIPNLSTMGPGAGDRYTPGGGAQPQQQPQAPAGGQDGQGWTTLPNGVRIREVQ